MQFLPAPGMQWAMPPLSPPDVPHQTTGRPERHRILHDNAVDVDPMTELLAYQQNSGMRPRRTLGGVMHADGKRRRQDHTEAVARYRDIKVNDPEQYTAGTKDLYRHTGVSHFAEADNPKYTADESCTICRHMNPDWVPTHPGNKCPFACAAGAGGGIFRERQAFLITKLHAAVSSMKGKDSSNICLADICEPDDDDYQDLELLVDSLAPDLDWQDLGVTAAMVLCKMCQWEDIPPRQLFAAMRGTIES
jgi:hypothetical protein